MAIVTINKQWPTTGLAPKSSFNYRDTGGGVFERYPNDHGVIEDLATRLNHLLARRPRVVFGQAQTNATSRTTNGNGTFSYFVMDNVQNARKRIVRLAVMPNKTGDSLPWVGTTNYVGKGAIGTIKATDRFPEDIEYQTFTITRGTASNANLFESIVTNGSYNIVDVCIQDSSQIELNTDWDQCVDHRQCAPSATVISNVAEEIRAKLHHLRTTNLDVIASWAAQTQDGTYVYPATSNECGIVFSHSNGDYINLIDTKHKDTRTSNSAGFCFSADSRGWGASNYAANCVFSVLARAQGGNGTVRFIGAPGPGGTINNADLRISAIADIGWWNSSPIMVDVTQRASVQDTRRGKVDMLGLMDGANSNITIFGVRGFLLP